MKLIDCRGLDCPAPVLKTKEAVVNKKLNKVTILVDNEAAKQNVSRFLEFQKFQVLVQEKDEVFYVTGKKGENAADTCSIHEKTDTDEKKIMVMVATDHIGHGDDELGSKLMMSFLKTIKEMGNELWLLVFVNNGVKLTTTDSEILATLKDYEAEGLHILVCGTCLTHFDLLDKKEVGETTNMLDIVMAMQLADKVINI